MGKDLHTLIRLRKFEVDERRRDLGVLLQRQAALEAEGRALDAEFAREVSFAQQNPAFGLTLGAYVSHFRWRKDDLLEREHQLDEDILEAREALAEAYRTLKTIEVTQENRENRERQEREHKDQLFLDEVAQDRYRRRSHEGDPLA
ncbi:hypothetical protein [Pararhodospirillum photometricum]|uniref:Flagellar FliJ protein n=1 Tax=Pararhodospirillum photometricum DSM 122 TaxID=1150469 RepID=H6SIG8_PARPM|nr:hypothetical protein [Pararhodospirillum photometricum]CCG06734.1 Putative uncharacterized protein [Pararhodospirillum photometricum DSM 122]